MSRERKVTVEHERGADEYSGRDVCVRVQATPSTSAELYLTEGEARQLLRGLLRAPGFDDATAAIARVRARLGDILPDWSDSGVIAVADILAALDGAPEPEGLPNHCQSCGAWGTVEVHLRGCSLDGAPEPEAERDAALAAIERVRALETFSITDSYPAWTAVDHDDLLAALDGGRQ